MIGEKRPKVKAVFEKLYYESHYNEYAQAAFYAILAIPKWSSEIFTEWPSRFNHPDMQHNLDLADVRPTNRCVAEWIDDKK